MIKKNNSNDNQIVRIVSYDEEGLSEIELLWEKLNKYLGKCSTYFSDAMRKKTFHGRYNEIIKNNALVKVYVAYCNEAKVGYCISKIDNISGEIESLYVDTPYRGKGIGSMLVKRSLEWFDNLKIDKISVTVSIGNEKVISFYNQFDFYERNIVLQRKNHLET